MPLGAVPLFVAANSAILLPMNRQTTLWSSGAVQPSISDHPSGDVGLQPWQQWLTVTQLNERIRDLLEEALPFVRLRGEISDLRQPPSGHL